MAAGLGLVGIAGYVLLALAGHTLAPADVATVTSVYLLLNILGPGLYVALEQETNRAVASCADDSAASGTTVRNAGLVGAALVGITLAVLAVSSPVLVPRVLGGNWGLLAVLMVSTTVAGALFLVRGAFGGQRRFIAYAATLGLEGGARLVPCVVIAAMGVATATGYGFAFAAGYGVAVLAALPWAAGWFRRARAATAERPGQLARGVALLGVATLLSFAVSNIAPVVVNARLVAQPLVAAAFGQAFVLARAPMLVFAPVQTMLLPGLTAAAERGDTAMLRTRIRQIALAVIGVGLPGAVGAALLGPWLLRVLFGVERPPTPLVMGLLGLSTVMLMAAQAFQPALVAMRRHHAVTLSWVVGTVLLVGLLALPIHPVDAALTAQLVGSAVVVLGCVLGLRADLRRRAEPAGVGNATG